MRLIPFGVVFEMPTLEIVVIPLLSRTLPLNLIVLLEVNNVADRRLAPSKSGETIHVPFFHFLVPDDVARRTVLGTYLMTPNIAGRCQCPSLHYGEAERYSHQCLLESLPNLVSLRQLQVTELPVGEMLAGYFGHQHEEGVAADNRMLIIDAFFYLVQNIREEMRRRATIRLREMFQGEVFVPRGFVDLRPLNGIGCLVEFLLQGFHVFGVGVLVCLGATLEPLLFVLHVAFDPRDRVFIGMNPK